MYVTILTSRKIPARPLSARPRIVASRATSGCGHAGALESGGSAAASDRLTPPTSPANDADHAGAVDVFGQANTQRWQLVTTNAVVVETHALLLNRTREGRILAIKFLDDLESSGLRVERVSETDEKAAISLIRGHQDKTYSLCDALSFVVCERVGITETISCHVTTTQVWNPSTNDDDAVLEPGTEYLTEIDENAPGGADLSRPILVLHAGLGHHAGATAFQAGRIFCSSKACAASSPRPPQWARSTYV